MDPCTVSKYYTTCIRHTLMDTSSITLNLIKCMSFESVTGHLQVTVTQLQRSCLHSVNQNLFGSVLDIFYLSGCTQPVTTQHTPSIPPKGTACTLLTREEQVVVSTPVKTNPNPFSQPKLLLVPASNTIHCHTCKPSITPCGCSATTSTSRHTNSS